MQVNNNDYNVIFPVTYASDEAAEAEIKQLNASNKVSQEDDTFLAETAKKIAAQGLAFLSTAAQLKNMMKQMQNVELSLKDIAAQVIKKHDASKVEGERIDATLRWMNSFPLARESLLKVVRAVEMVRRTHVEFPLLKNEDDNEIRQSAAIMTAQPLMQEIKERVVRHYTGQILQKLYDFCLEQNRKAICY